ncbi:OPT oligopeptide transporter protein-domain-containing protein [Halteromyces radiatus]|uniref:OPT oligopeptide transporter protein-domain-containing protein n=1 Tax=Halteromyces radiatus TaxID=101107 RepID=UPI00221F9502|nr:OPT oligopeptide transporter protein-domain-containing protein [Halteromyces radiatus]KAI8093891.1 OPT oligopeptide transporter protein-domain-containing protein [Halteromyces radiatus]
MNSDNDEQQRKDDLIEQHFTWRAVLIGLLIGTLLCFSNMYFGLQSGWISMMSLQACLLGFLALKPMGSSLSMPENVLQTTVSVAAGTMPLAAGFVGIIPALALLTVEDNPGSESLEAGPIELSSLQLLIWCMGVMFFGVFLAVPLRKQVVIREKLPFPSGTATAQMISFLHHRQLDSSYFHNHHQSRLSSTSLDSTNDYFPYDQTPSLMLVSMTTNTSQATIEHDSSSSASTLETPSTLPDYSHTWKMKLSTLMVSFGISAFYTFLSYFFPVIYALPVFNWLTLNWIDFYSWLWYFTPSFSYIGQGIIMGLSTTLSMLLGSIVGWGILSPIAYHLGWAPGPVNDWKNGSKGWIIWISLGVMLSESLTSLLILIIKSLITNRSKRHSPDYQKVDQMELTSTTPAPSSPLTTVYHHNMRTSQDDNINDHSPTIASNTKLDDVSSEHLVPGSITYPGLVLSVILCVGAVAMVFGTKVLPVGMSLLALVLASFLGVLAVRALGETDLNPVSGIGKISQILFALFMPGNIVANLIVGGIAEAGAQQAGDLMQDLKMGHILKASPKAQFYGQILGSLYSAFITTGIYWLFKSVYTIPGPEFAVPTAQVWLDMSRLMNGQPLPPHAIEFMVFFSVLFVMLTVLKETGDPSDWRRFLPKGIAFAIGIYNPPNFTIARVIGGLMVYGWYNYCDAQQTNTDIKRKFDRLAGPYRDQIGHVFIIIIASGFVLGEGTFAIINMAMQACHVPHF